MSIDKLREHDERVEEIYRKYRQRLFELNDAMADVVRARDKELKNSFQRYLDEAGLKNCICSDTVQCAYHHGNQQENL